MRKSRGPVGGTARGAVENVGSVTEEPYPENSTACHWGQAVDVCVAAGVECSAHSLHVRRVQPLGTRLDLELDLLTLGKRLESIHGDCGKMHKDILAAFL